MIFSLPGIVNAGTRDLLHQQGLLVDLEGVAVEGLHEITFSIYSTAEGGDPIWEETFLENFSGGLYSVDLGETVALPDDLFQTSEDLYLAIAVDRGEELTPRFSITAVPMARMAEVATTALAVDDSIVLPRVFIEGFGEVINTSGQWVGPTISGTQGAQGATGPTGAIGPQGPAGAQGNPTTVTAGTGLSGGGSGATVTLDVGAGTGLEVAADSIGIATGGVTTTQILDGTITTTDLSAAAGLTDGQINNNLTVSGGTVDNTPVGSSSRSTGAFTTLTTDGQAAFTAEPFGTNAGNTGEIRLRELTAGGSNYVGLKSPDALAGNLVWVLPSADGSAGQILSTDGSGNLTWASDANAGGDITAVTAGTGLSGGGTSGSVTLTAALGSTVDTVEIEDGTITNTDISVSAAIADTKLGTISTAGKVSDSALSSNVSLLGSAIESSEITDLTITNGDISSSAAIADSKLATISSAGKVSGAALTSLASIPAGAGIIPDANTSLGGTIESAEISDGTITAADLGATLTFSDGDRLDLSAIDLSDTTEGLILPQSDSVTNATAEGKIAWDADNDILYLGTGSSVTPVSNPFGAAIDSSEITDATITNSDISGTAAISDSKLGTISSSGKVSGAALTSLASIPAGAGTIPAVNTPLGSTIESAEISDGTITTDDLNATLTFSDGDLISLSAIDMSSTTEGLILPQADSVTNATAEGKIAWDANDDTLYVGTGSAAVAVGNPFGGSVDSSEITDSTITNTDISGSAAIAGTKVSPDFGSQNVTTTGDLSASGGFKMMIGPFVKRNVPNSGTPEQWIVAHADNDVVYVGMPWSGSIIGVSISCDVDITAGSVTVEATNNEAGVGLSATLNDSSGSSDYVATATQSKDTDTFVAGNRIGCYATASSLSPATPECICVVFVEM